MHAEGIRYPAFAGTVDWVISVNTGTYMVALESTGGRINYMLTVSQADSANPDAPGTRQSAR